MATGGWSALRLVIGGWLVFGGVGLVGADPEEAAGAEEDPGILVRYHAPYPKDATEPEDTAGSLYPAGTKLYVASPSLNVRAEPTKEAASTGRLDFGAEVSIVEIDPRCVSEDGVQGHWMKVTAAATGDQKATTGFVFGGYLTPARLVADFDGSGSNDIATVAFAGDGKTRVRFRDEKDTASEVQVVDLAPGRENEPGDVGVGAIAREVTGVALVKVRSRYESCGAFAETYVSFTKGQKGSVAKEALNLVGVSDPPVFSTFTTKFDPAARSVVVSQEDKSQDENGKDTVETRETKYQFEDGVYRKSGK